MGEKKKEGRGMGSGNTRVELPNLDVQHHNRSSPTSVYRETFREGARASYWDMRGRYPRAELGLKLAGVLVSETVDSEQSIPLFL